MPLSRKFGVTASTFSQDPRLAADAARSIGFEGLLFDVFSTALDLTQLSGTGLREFRHIISSKDQQLIGLNIDLGMKGLGPGADLDRLLWQFESVLKTAAGLVTPLVCVETGPLPHPPRAAVLRPKITPAQAGLILIPSFDDTPEVAPVVELTRSERDVMSAVDSAAVELGVLADRYNTRVCFRSELSTFSAVDRLLKTARCTWFGVDLDPVAVLRDEWSADEIFSAVGPLIGHVRGRDAVRGIDRRTKPAVIGRGDTAWDQMLANLEAADYRGWITLDPAELSDRPAAARAGLRYLKLHE